MQLKALKARIARADYEVDTQAVAEAIVRRLVEARRRADFRPEPPGAPRPAIRAVWPAVSDDVLEAG